MNALWKSDIPVSIVTMVIVKTLWTFAKKRSIHDELQGFLKYAPSLAMLNSKDYKNYSILDPNSQDWDLP